MYTPTVPVLAEVPPVRLSTIRTVVVRYGCLPLALALALASVVAGARQRQDAPPSASTIGPPRLVVVLVVDQMRADYIDRFEGDWTRGLRRITRTGARFVNAAYPYLGTYTCAGHSTIATGTLPYRHGNFQNTWYDRERKATVPCTDDAGADVVGYTGQPRAQVGPARLLEPTLADLLREQREARVVSLSLKARSAIMLAGHGGHAVTWLGDTPSGWQTSTPYSRTPNLAVQSFLDAHPMAADFRKVWRRLLPTPRYQHLDAAEGEHAVVGWERTFPHQLIGTGQPDKDFRAQWETSPLADAFLGAFAAHLAETERLGRRGTTDVLLVSFSSPDAVGHRFGPRSHETQDMYAHLDRTIGTLFDRLDRLVGRDRYVVAFTSDHGVAEIPEQAVRRGEDAGRVLTPELRRTVEVASRAALGAGPPSALVASVNSNDIYFEPGVYARLRADPKALDRIVTAVAGHPGIARVFRSEQLASSVTADDPLLRAAALSYVHGRSGDLIVALKPGWISGTTPATHGTANAYDQRVPLLLMGAGVTPGRYTEPTTPADIAPTLAALCGVAMTRAEGRVLRTALTDAARGAPTAAAR